MENRYVHGHHPRELERLQDQAGALVELLHADTTYPAGSSVLEVGCGAGAQTLTLARNSPLAQITAIDLSMEALAAAAEKVKAAGLSNVTFHQCDLYSQQWPAHSFNHVFVCFVLEHLVRPLEVLQKLRLLIKPGGTITVIEGDHGSAYFHPDSAYAHEAIHCQVELQRRAGGNAMIGRQVYPLLVQAGFIEPRVSPRLVYVDASRPGLVDAFTKKTFTAMIEGVRASALAAGLAEPSRFDEGIRALYRTTESDGVFCYTFFKGVASVSTS